MVKMKKIITHKEKISKNNKRREYLNDQSMKSFMYHHSIRNIKNQREKAEERRHQKWIEEERTTKNHKNPNKKRDTTEKEMLKDD